MRRLYLAYGSNLSLKQINERCPGNEAVAAVSIQGYRLEFAGEKTRRWGDGGVATIVPDQSEVCWGALYRLSDENERSMDGYEGVPEMYMKQEDWAGRVAGYMLQPKDIVFTYVKRMVAPLQRPSRRYIETIRQGYQDWLLPEEAIQKWLPEL